MGHSAAIIGHAMFIYGGIYGEENKVLEEPGLFDFLNMNWARISHCKS